MALERLDKLLSASGLYSRSQARAVILAGRVTVDGAAVRRPEMKIDRSGAVMAEGRAVDTARFVYYMMNKPAGYISATQDGAWPAVTGLLPKELQGRGVFPAGRLDADVTGLLLLTDDGVFAHRVTSPRSGIRKEYEVLVDGPLTEVHVSALAAGVTMADGTAYRPALLRLDASQPRRGVVTVTEGRFHEVKNLMTFCGRRVERMRRLAIGGLRLDEDLAEGAVRRLTMEEKDACLDGLCGAKGKKQGVSTGGAHGEKP